MPAWALRLFLTAGIAVAATASALAEQPTFADLLARAEAQAAAGHRWSPPGDNMTETVAGMMDLIGTATPKQLAELSTLLETDSTAPPSQAPEASSAAQASLAPAYRPDAPAAMPDRSVAKPANPFPAKSGPRAAELLARGRDAEKEGNLSGARRFYASAAELGEATAARNLGRLYDPAYLKQTAIGGIEPDPQLARHWYERAVTMGDADAAPLLQALAVR